MAINKVVYGNDTLIDLTNTTATADRIVSGAGAYGADGVWIDGTLTEVFPSDDNPAMDSTASPGVSINYSRADHVHPTDTSRQAKITASGILKGDGSGGVSAAVAGTDYVVPADLSTKQNKIGASGILKGSGMGIVGAAVAGTDYLTPETNYSPVITASSDYYLSQSDSGKTIILGTSSSGDITVTINQANFDALPFGAEIAFVKDNGPSNVARLKIVNIGFGNARVGWTTANANGVYVTIPKRYGMITLKKIFNVNSAMMLFGNVEVST